MKTEFEAQEIQKIAERTVEMLKPHLTRTAPTVDQILDTDGLATYLAVDISWIYKQVQRKAIPYYKVGKYIRFKKSAIDRWLEGRRVDPICFGNPARLRVSA